MAGLYYVIISVVFNVLGQYSMKIGMNKYGEVTFDDHVLLTIYRIFILPNVIIGLIMYAISAVFWLIALSKLDLSIAYPTLSIGYILVMILSVMFLNETITIYKILGTVLIISGIVLLFKS
jgi:multidrug transporter EmrE-like cation transporter